MFPAQDEIFLHAELQRLSYLLYFWQHELDGVLRMIGHGFLIILEKSFLWRELPPDQSNQPRNEQVKINQAIPAESSPGSS
jgi:hypothetical protein